MNISYEDKSHKDGLKVYVVNRVFDSGGYDHSESLVGIAASHVGAKKLVEEKQESYDPPFIDYNEDSIQVTIHDLNP